MKVTPGAGAVQLQLPLHLLHQLLRPMVVYFSGDLYYQISSSDRIVQWHQFSPRISFLLRVIHEKITSYPKGIR